MITKNCVQYPNPIVSPFWQNLQNQLNGLYLAQCAQYPVDLRGFFNPCLLKILLLLPKKYKLGQSIYLNIDQINCMKVWLIKVYFNCKFLWKGIMKHKHVPPPQRTPNEPTIVGYWVQFFFFLSCYVDQIFIWATNKRKMRIWVKINSVKICICVWKTWALFLMEAWAGISKSSHISRLLWFQVPEIISHALSLGLNASWRDWVKMILSSKCRTLKGLSFYTHSVSCFTFL